ncbi:hypothetical protein PENTCL1PPCAC_16056, partial [Pristionchus entomophagus]
STPKHSNNSLCVYCGKHSFSFCPNITSIQGKRTILKEKKLCFKCLSSKHTFHQCDRKCSNCSKPHHKYLCDSVSNNPRSTLSSINAAVTANEPVNGIARLHTTSVTLQNPLTNRAAIRHVLLDSGAMISLISRSLTDELNLKQLRTMSMSISGVGGVLTGAELHDVLRVNIMTTKGLYPIEALVTDTIITRPMYLQPLSAEDYAVVQSHCGHVPHLAENSIITPDLLISIAEKSKLLACKTSMDLPSGYELVQSILGPMVIGRSHSNRLIPNHSILTSLITDTPFEKRIERFMSVDESARDYGTTETEARLQQNQKVEEHFHETSEIVDNQYEVQYFLKPEVSELPTNNELAFTRLKSTSNTLSKNVSYIEFYDSIIKDQLTAGMIEEVNPFIPSGQCHYLAHLAVLRPDKPTTPLRIVIETHLMSASNRSDAHQVSQLINKVYVDNAIINCDNPTQEMYTMSKSLFQEMHMNLRDYASNSIPFIQSVQESDRAPSGDQKLLGLFWNPSNDDLAIRIPSLIRHSKETKRAMLSSVASIYDPLGLLQPLTLQSKLHVHQLWCQDLKWDQHVDSITSSRFHEMLTDIESFHLTIPRYSGMSSSNEIHLVAFADASKLAMGAVIYLNALVIAHSLLRYVVDAIQKEFPDSIIHTHVYSDSAIALFWNLNDTNKKNNGTFVSNREKSIREMENTLSSTRNVHYHSAKYVRTDANPADHITRGLSANELNDPNHMWWRGAPWMKDPPEKWPNDPIPPTADPPYTRIAESIPTPLIDFERYSTLNKAIKVTGFVLRYIQRSLINSTNTKLKEKFNKIPVSSIRLLTALERTRALHTLIRNHQSCHIQTHDS